LTNLYVRIRGRVHGPFDTKKLKLMVQNGQLSRIHQVSIDGQEWQKAADFPDLFQTGVGRTVAAASQSVAQPQSSHGKANQTHASTTPPGQADHEWYYSLNNERLGPVHFSKLQSLAESGQLGQSNLVWRDGFADWQPATSVDGLFAPSKSLPAFIQEPKQASVSSSSNAEEISPGALRTLSDTKPWVLFVAIAVAVLGACMAFGGLLLIIFGGKADNGIAIGEGITSFIYAGALFFGSILLFKISSLMGQCLMRPTTSNLSLLLLAYKNFWFFVGIVLIVLLVFFVFFVVWAFAFASSLPAF